MRLTRQYEIAIRILEACARAPRRRWTIEQAAKTATASKHYTAHIVAELVRGGYLRSERGRRGGLYLAMPAEAIGLGEVLRLSRSGFASTGSPAQSSLSVAGDRLGMIVGAGTASFIRFMDRYTIADLVSGSAFGPVACFDCNLVNPSRPSPDAVVINPVQMPAISRKLTSRRAQREHTT